MHDPAANRSDLRVDAVEEDDPAAIYLAAGVRPRCGLNRSIPMEVWERRHTSDLG